MQKEVQEWEMVVEEEEGVGGRSRKRCRRRSRRRCRRRRTSRGSRRRLE